MGLTSKLNIKIAKNYYCRGKCMVITKRLKRVVKGSHWLKEGNICLNIPSRKHCKRSKRQFILINIFGLSKQTHWRKNVLPL
jgi:hypothetical protein